MWLFHVSDRRIDRFDPRPSPPGTDLAGVPLVWAVDEERLPHYLLPRECPRVCWLDDGGRHVAIEQGWVDRVHSARLAVHRLDPAPFRPITEWWGAEDPSGYWVSATPVEPLAVDDVDDCWQAIESTGARLVAVDDLQPTLEAVRHLPFSAIRMRNAQPSAG